MKLTKTPKETTKMKITKETLKQIIKEELQSLKEGEMTRWSDAPHEDDMSAGEYYASSVMGLRYDSAEASVLDELSAAIGSTIENKIQPKDILAFVQQVLGDAQSNQVIDV